MGKETDFIDKRLKQIERTFRFDGYVRFNEAPFIDIYREKFWVDEKDASFGPSEVAVKRVSWEEIKDKKWTLKDGTTIGASQIYEALALAFDEATEKKPDPVVEPLPDPVIDPQPVEKVQ